MTQDNCQTVWDLIQELENRVVDPSLELRIADHLDQCQSCREKIDSSYLQQESEVICGLRLAGTTATIPRLGCRENETDDAQQVREHARWSFYYSLLAPSDDPRSIGRIGMLEILGILGHGGAGIVFKGYDPSLGRLVAVKMLDPTVRNQADARARFLREARSMAAISHEHVVPIYAVAEHRQLPYLVMEYVAGGTLARRLQDESHLNLIQTIRIGIQVASGLAAAHRQGVVHRDVKPANILLDPGVERVRVADFGLARGMTDHTQTESGTLLGTPHFMSPEQVRSEPIDGRSDLFSLGSVLYLTSTGKYPFESETVYGLMQKILTTDPIAPSQLNPELPVWFDQFVLKLLSKSASDRFADAQQVSDVLEQELAFLQQPVGQSVPKREWIPPAKTSTQSERQRSSWVVRAVVLTGLLSMIGIAYLVYKSLGFNATLASDPKSSMVAQDPETKRPTKAPGDFAKTAMGKQIDKILDKLNPKDFSGCVLVAHRGEPILVRSIGKLGTIDGGNLDSNALFEVGSITKLFASVAVLKLAEQGKLKLDDSIAAHLPNVPESCKAITIRHLLQYRSGIPGDTYGNNRLETNEFIASLLEGGPKSEPGTKFEYWNQGYSLVGQIIAKVSRRSFEEFVRTEIFAPAEMKGSCFLGDKATSGFRPTMGTGKMGMPRLCLEHPYGGVYLSYSAIGGLITNVHDLWKFNVALSAEKLISADSIGESMNAGKFPAGLGWHISPGPEGRQRIGMAGKVRGFVSQIRRYPDSDSCIVVLCNRDDIELFSLVDNIEDCLHAPVDGKVRDGLVESDQRLLPGEYWTKNGRKLILSKENNRILFRLLWSPQIEGGPVSWGFVRKTKTNKYECVSSVETIETRIKFSTDKKSVQSIRFGKEADLEFYPAEGSSER